MRFEDRDCGDCDWFDAAEDWCLKYNYTTYPSSEKHTLVPIEEERECMDCFYYNTNMGQAECLLKYGNLICTHDIACNAFKPKEEAADE